VARARHAARLAAALDAVLTRETGGTAIGRRIRAILHDTAVTDLADRAEALLTAADRAQHLAARWCSPALAAGRHVVSDRSVHSTLAYQGYGRGLPSTSCAASTVGRSGTWPHLVVLLDVAPERCRPRRMHGRELDRFEREESTTSTSACATASTRWPRPIPSTGWSSTPAARTEVYAAIRCRPCATARPVSAVPRASPSVWDASSASERAVDAAASDAARHPVHAYLFVGPPGSTKDRAARAFAAALLAGGDDPDHATAGSILAGEHPDVREVRRVGAAISAEQIEDIVRTASLAPVEGDAR
jgi:dTMP kinase